MAKSAKGHAKAHSKRPVTKKFVKNFLKNRVGRAEHPFFGSIEMTRRCNEKCAFCPIGNEKAEIKKGEMATADVKRVLDQFNDLNIFAVSFLGGEPFLRKDLCEIARYARKVNIITQVSTNATAIPDLEDAVASLDVIVVSLDTLDPKKYANIRGLDKYDLVVENIKEMVRLSHTTKPRGAKILVNTVICSKNIDEVPDVIKFAHGLGVDGIMVDFATFHDYWEDITNDKSRYNPKEYDWRNRREDTKALIRKVIRMKKEYPILTAKSYMETFLREDFSYKCYPYLFACVRKDGRISIPCWDSKVTKYYNILGKETIKDIWFSEDARKRRKAVKNCSDCYMHCIVEPSKVLGAPSRNLLDLMDWIRTFRKHRA